MSAFGGKADITVCGSPLSRSLSGVKRTCGFAAHMSAFNPKRTFRPHRDSKDATGEPMQYFEASDGKPERIGKVIGDTLAALVILFILWLVLNFVFG